MNKKRNGGCGCLFLIIIIGIFIGFIINTDPETNIQKTQSVSIPSNSEWDGSVRQVKTWLKDNLKDPKSIEYIDWSPVSKWAQGYKVRCKYRSKNSFGGYVINNHLFYIQYNENGWWEVCTVRDMNNELKIL